MNGHSEASLRALLRAMHPKDTHFFAASVRNSTGYAARTVRTADAIAMSLWPSRGLHLQGFEIKCARNDWLRELKDPAKAEDIASRCDYWWIVAPGENSGFGPAVVKMEEVPANWGWLAPGELPRKKGLGLIEMKAPVKLQPAPMDRLFLAGILRAAQEDSPHEKELARQIEKIRNEEHQKYVDRINAAEKAEDTRAQSALVDLQMKVDSFERASGVRISNYGSGDVGKAVKVIMDHGKDHTARYLTGQAEEMRRAADLMVAAASELTPKVEPTHADANENSGRIIKSRSGHTVALAFTREPSEVEDT